MQRAATPEGRDVCDVPRLGPGLAEHALESHPGGRQPQVSPTDPGLLSQTNTCEMVFWELCSQISQLVFSICSKRISLCAIECHSRSMGELCAPERVPSHRSDPVTPTNKQIFS